VRAGTAMGSAASTAYRLGQETSGSGSIGAGLAGMASAGGAGAAQKLRDASGLGSAAERGQRAALFAGATRPGAASAAAGEGASTPDWARRLRSEQTARHHRNAALQAVREGERGGSAANPDIKEKEE
jgi:type IV secretion system protein TrbL